MSQMELDEIARQERNRRFWTKRAARLSAEEAGPTMPRMRTIAQAAVWLREIDPDTAFTKTALRRLVVSGQLPSVRVGTKYLLNLDTIEDDLLGQLPASSLVQGTREAQL